MRGGKDRPMRPDQFTELMKAVRYGFIITWIILSWFTLMLMLLGKMI